MPADEEVVVNTRLAGTRQFLAGAAAEAAAIRDIDKATTGAGSAMKETTKRGFLMNQALFTIRRFTYTGTIALLSMTSAVVGFGIAFNSSMEMNTVAMTHFVGSTALANTELNHLYKLAATTPFEFSNITDAARRFLAFGFTLRDTNKYLSILGDTAAGLGLGNEGINRLVLVFGQIRASGRVLGGDLLQLAQAGVPALQILQKQLHLTQEQMANIGQLRIPAAVAIPALMRGLSRQFKGMAAEQARTFQGQLSTLHDYASQLAGTLTLPLFNRLRNDVFPKMNVLIGDMQKAAKAGGLVAAVKAMDQDLTPRSHRVLEAFRELRAMEQDVARITTRVLVPGLGLLWATLGLGSPPMKLVISLLGFAAHHTTLLSIALGYLTARFIYARTVALAFGLASKLAGGDLYKLFGVTKASTAAMKLYALWVYRAELAQLIAARATKLWAAATLVTTRALRLAAGAMALLDAALLANPIGLVIVGVVALAAGLVTLYFKWQAFHDFVNKTFGWIKTHWPLLLGILTGPFGLAFEQIVQHISAVKHALLAAFNWIISQVHRLTGFLDSIWQHIPGHGLLGKLAGGIGNLFGGGGGGGLQLGPPVPLLSQSDKRGIQPVFARQEAWMNNQQPIDLGDALKVNVQVKPQDIYLDGRVIAENVTYHQQGADARR